MKSFFLLHAVFALISFDIRLEQFLPAPCVIHCCVRECLFKDLAAVQTSCLLDYWMSRPHGSPPDLSRLLLLLLLVLLLVLLLPSSGSPPPPLPLSSKRFISFSSLCIFLFHLKQHLFFSLECNSSQTHKPKVRAKNDKIRHDPRYGTPLTSLSFPTG